MEDEDELSQGSVRKRHAPGKGSGSSTGDVGTGLSADDLRNMFAQFASTIQTGQLEIMSQVDSKISALGNSLIEGLGQRLARHEDATARDFDTARCTMADVSGRVNKIEKDQQQMWESINKLSETLTVLEQGPRRVINYDNGVRAIN